MKYFRNFALWYMADTPIHAAIGAKLRAAGCFDKKNSLLELIL